MSDPPSVSELKRQASAIRLQLAEDGEIVTHSKALELVAKEHGHRDWNTACAAAKR